MEDNMIKLNVPYKMITVDSRGEKSILLTNIILSIIALCILFILHISFFFVDFTETGNMVILDHIGCGLILGGLIFIVPFALFCHLKRCLRIYRSNKSVNLFIVTMSNSHQLGSLHDEMYICFIDVRGMIIGYKEDQHYIDDFLYLNKLQYFDFIKIYEKQNIANKGGKENE